MGPILETLKRRGDAVDMSGTCIPPTAVVDIMKVNNNVQPTAVDARGTVAHDPLSLGSRTPAMDGLDVFLESAFDQAVRTQVESAGHKYTPPERTTVVDPELKAAADRLVAAAPLLNRALARIKQRQLPTASL
jgi:hypothetical protein